MEWRVAFVDTSSGNFANFAVEHRRETAVWSHECEQIDVASNAACELHEAIGGVDGIVVPSRRHSMFRIAAAKEDVVDHVVEFFCEWTDGRKLSAAVIEQFTHARFDVLEVGKLKRRQQSGESESKVPPANDGVRGRLQ